MTNGVVIRIPETNFELDASEVERLVGELDKLERPEATAVAKILRKPPALYEPSGADLIELVRALEHLRILAITPEAGLDRLHYVLIGGYGSRRYRVDPQTEGKPFETYGYGPAYVEGDRLVDFRTKREWIILKLDPDTDPIELTVEPWKPAAERL